MCTVPARAGAVLPRGEGQGHQACRRQSLCRDTAACRRCKQHLVQLQSVNI